MSQPIRAVDPRHAFRHVYSPSPDRMPRWVWRVWAWF